MNRYIPGRKIRISANTDFEYSYFLPNKLPRTYTPSDPSLHRLLEDATHKLGELNAFARFVPDIDFFIRMHEAAEATASSKIEGTQTSINEAIMQVEDISPERRDDWAEVQNYIAAMSYAIDQLNTLPVSTRLLNNTHEILMQGVRGEDKSPGCIRTSQNWIGGATLKDARFIPTHQSHIHDLMSDLETYINTNDLQIPLLVKAGMAHYQFETIHPYLDGNGRIGRLLIILYLIERKLLDRPVLYLSKFFVRHRQEYYDALDRVRSHGDIEQWLKFFLVGVAETAQTAVDTLRSIKHLQENDQRKILGMGRRAERAEEVLRHLFKQPIVEVADIEKLLKVTYATANTMVEELSKIKILHEVTGFSRNRIFVYGDYLALFNNGEEYA